MKLKQCNIKGFFTYGFSSLLSFALKRKRCRQFVLREFQVNVLGLKGRNFLATKKFVLATKSKILGASWPQGFFSKVEPCIRSITNVDNICKAQLYFILFGLSFAKIFERNALLASQEKGVICF